MLKRNGIDTKAEVNEYNEEQAKFLLELVHGKSELLDYDTLINSINKDDEDWYMYHMYDKVLGHKKGGKLYVGVLWVQGRSLGNPTTQLERMTH